MIRLTLDIDMERESCAVSLARICNRGGRDYPGGRCPVGHILPCPFVTDKQTKYESLDRLCVSVKPDDWLRHLEVVDG